MITINMNLKMESNRTVILKNVSQICKYDITSKGLRITIILLYWVVSDQ